MADRLKLEYKIIYKKCWYFIVYKIRKDRIWINKLFYDFDNEDKASIPIEKIDEL